MDIGIDITPLQTGHKDRGIGIYTKLLIESLQKYEKKHSYHFFTRGQKVPKGVELIHYPYFDPFFVTLPVSFQKPTVITIHDLIPLVFPSHFPSGIRGAIGWFIQRNLLSRAHRVLVDSHASARDVSRIAGISQERIDVVYLAPSPAFRSLNDREMLTRVKRAYKLPDTYMLYVGDVNWNKNVMGLLQAFRLLASPMPSLALVLVGKAFRQHSREAREIDRYIHREGLGDAVVRVGGVPLEDLVALYSLASVYIQPSFYEGFGLPVLEAMACGVPVVTSKAGSLCEIAGPAITAESTSPEDIARGIDKALRLAPAKRAALVAAQGAWVKTFTWETVAHETVRSYEKALG